MDTDGKIVDAKFKTFGCGSAIASSSLATEWVKGRTVRVFTLFPDHSPSLAQIDEAGKLKNQDIAKELSLPPVKLHCSSMSQEFPAFLFWGRNSSRLLTSSVCLSARVQCRDCVHAMH